MHASNMPTAGNNIPSPKRLKNEAREIRRHDPQLSQGAALDQAANARGLPSYKIVERAWRSRDRASSAHAVTLTASWGERGRGDWGRIHANVALSEPWANFLPLTDRRHIRSLGRFHIVRGDRTRLVSPEDYASFLSCAHHLSKAARQLVFVDALRVLPVSLAKTVAAFRGDPHRMLSSRYPDQDHESLWRDPATGLHFILNEPYQVDQEKQAPILAERGMVAFTTHDWTLHNPAGTLAQLIAPVSDQTLLHALSKRAQTLPARFDEITFADDDGLLLDIFQS
ncbi:hypothetical protein [Delftia tsuruhatensis]|uniref:hypothetical protein n=1 Tax=Delftia tsuruhatensis TaxID=180282 RepID=UPI0023DBAE8B|nr:hypothetical protein [Delftia tsuruhatensis]WEL99007.1 hypothetical protein PW274_01690 [Delftia tsuruhatensis]